MRTKYQPQLSQYAIPDGEGFNALPIFFCKSIMSLRACDSKRSNLRVELEIASSGYALLATTNHKEVKI